MKGTRVSNDRNSLEDSGTELERERREQVEEIDIETCRCENSYSHELPSVTNDWNWILAADWYVEHERADDNDHDLYDSID